MKQPINWEKYTALSSMLVAVFALAISIWQGYSMQQHNKLSLRPYLEMEFNFNEGGSWELFIHNQGLGPAQVTDVQYKVDGTVHPNRDEFLKALGEQPECFVRGNIGRFYKVSDQQIVFRTLNKTCSKTEAELMAMLSRMQIVLDYESLYGETYQLVIGNTE